MKRTYLIFLLIVLLALPTVIRMVRPGLYSMQDFPYFRAVQYTKCLKDGQWPCRWAPDAGLGYGEPVFNFYSHVPFLIPAAITQVGLPTTFALKFTFAFSLVASALGMFLLSRLVWKSTWAGLVSSILYLYAPYRAVNVWVRGALAESFAFVLLPLILFSFEKYLASHKKRWLVSFALLLTALVLTHNLSVLLFAFTISGWIIVRLFQTKKLKLIINLLFGSLVSALLSAFYLIPSLLESNLVNLSATTTGYFDFRAHFVTTNQLLFSRYWGYGGSTWGMEDGLSLSVGHVQWIVGLLVIIAVAFRFFKSKKLKQSDILAVSLVSSALLFLLLTHNKSAPLWELTSSISKYIQFPWRFLGVAVFSLAFAAGYLGTIAKKYSKIVISLVVVLAIILNFGFFKEDLWLDVTDQELQTGDMWINQTRASIGDYWPKYGPIPTEYVVIPTDMQLLSSDSDTAKFEINLPTEKLVEFPISYFPGWIVHVDGQQKETTPSENGLVSASIPQGKVHATLTFTNSPARTLGNVVSLVTAIIGTLWCIKLKKQHSL